MGAEGASHKSGLLLDDIQQQTGSPGPGAPAVLSPRLLARNTLFNLLGQGLPLAVAVFSMPYLVRGLGPERFGLLSFAWVILGYFTLFDLGLGRATTKYVAELIGRGEEDRIPEVVRTALACQLTFGLLGGLTLFLLGPVLVDRVLRTPPEFAPEARGTLQVLSLGVPVVLVSSSLFAALEGRQRFDLANAVRIPASTGTYLLPVFGVALDADLPRIVLCVVLWKALTVGFLLLANRGCLGGGWARPVGTLFRDLLRFGGWVTVSSVVGPVLVYLDRLLLGALVSVAAVGYYAAPYDAVTRLSVLPTSLAAVLFPAFSTLSVNKDRTAAGVLLLRSVRLIAAVLAPLVLTIIVFAHELMTLWLGPEFAGQSFVALRVLAVGVLMNSLAHAPYALVQAMGRPDLPAKFHLLELPLYVAVAFILVTRLGITGAAWAWTCRVSLDAALLGVSAVRLSQAPGVKETAARAMAVAVALCALGAVTDWLRTSVLVGFERAWPLAVCLVAVGALVVLHTLLDRAERNRMLSGGRRG